MSRQPGDMRSRPPDRQNGATPGTGPDRSWRWALMVLLGVVVLAVLVSSVMSEQSNPSVSYSQFLTELEHGEVTKAQVNSNTGAITFVGPNGVSYDTQGPPGGYDPRRAQGQMSGIMSIGRSKAKVYTTERPRTTFADVAGYDGVKLEIREVVDFLRSANRFKEIGAKIPKGVLLVGPPGTGKTLLARAVAGEAGVPFLSVTGSDFMEMFVGVGASRVRDLFQTARKQAPAIIFIDEIDSIGRKRGAGLGGGHDEREQTLNQMLAEMDGFEATEGVVMMAATNRPDILDPALLRPGPLRPPDRRAPSRPRGAPADPEGPLQGQADRPDVDLTVVARGTPGMSGADLANLVNEAALHAVRRGASAIAMIDFEAARDRVLMGQRRESTVLSDKEKEATAYHEGGHAVLAYVLPDADPVHKVTILPTGMALGVTQQLPIEERHTYWREYIEDAVCVMMGGRCAEGLIWAACPPGPPTTCSGPPRWPARWSASSA
jgi:cell division protease FtsH